jgi:transformation/transcription domain-associated protein
VSIAYEQQGFFEQAQGAYEVAMSKVHTDYSSSPAPGSVRSELRLWEEHWIRQVTACYLGYLSRQGHLKA